MQLQMTEEIRRAVGQTTDQPVELIDPETRARYVLVPSDEYARMLSASTASIRDTYAAQEAVARAAGWDDPLMDDYNDYDAHRRTS